MNMEVGIFPSRTIKPSNKSKCAVEGCGSKAWENLDLCFHHFPRPNARSTYTRNSSGNLMKIDHYKAWKAALNLKKITHSTKVCSLHFRRDDYILPDAATKKRFLKKSAIPTCNLPNKKTEEITRVIIKNEDVDVEERTIGNEYAIANCIKCTKKGGEIGLIDSSNLICSSCNEMKTYTCPDCQKDFASYDDHINHDCLKKPIHICSTCGLMFQNKHGLRMHTRFCDKLEQLECSFCGHKFQIKIELKMHLYAEHVKNIKNKDLDELVEKEVDARNDRFAQRKKQKCNANSVNINTATTNGIKRSKLEIEADNRTIKNTTKIEDKMNMDPITKNHESENIDINPDISAMLQEAYKFQYENIECEETKIDFGTFNKQATHQGIHEFDYDLDSDNEELIIGI